MNFACCCFCKLAAKRQPAPPAVGAIYEQRFPDFFTCFSLIVGLRSVLYVLPEKNSVKTGDNAPIVCYNQYAAGFPAPCAVKAVRRNLMPHSAAKGILSW